jgi:hypothetical protein
MKILTARDIKQCPTLDILVVYFQVGQGRIQGTAPIDQSIRTVDCTFLVKTAESLRDSCREIWIHGIGFTGPVKRGTHCFQRSENGSLISILPLHGQVYKRWSAKVMASLFLLLPQHLLNHTLSRNARMVCTRYPNGCFPLHSVKASHCVLESLEKCIHLVP